MKINELLNKSADLLSGIDNSSNEARWILESTLNCNSSYIFLHPDVEIDSRTANLFIEKISQRAAGIPVQYILGEWEFYGRVFSVGSGVLIPRPETELLIDKALEYIRSNNCRNVLDLCAGTGCIGITLAIECPDIRVVSVEKFLPALNYLKTNIDRYGLANIEVTEGDVLTDYEMICKNDFDLILSNPPYINSEEITGLQREVQNEPVTALDGGTDGLDFYRCFAEKYTKKCSGAFIFECGEGQAETICRLFDLFGKTTAFKDFNGTERVVMAERV